MFGVRILHSDCQGIEHWCTLLLKQSTLPALPHWRGKILERSQHYFPCNSWPVTKRNARSFTIAIGSLAEIPYPRNALGNNKYVPMNKLLYEELQPKFDSIWRVLNSSKLFSIALKLFLPCTICTSLASNDSRWADSAIKGTKVMCYQLCSKKSNNNRKIMNWSGKVCSRRKNWLRITRSCLIESMNFMLD